MKRCAVRSSLIFLVIPAVMIGAGWGCGDEDLETPAPDNAEEVITTVNLTFTPVGGGTPVVATFRDADGPGGEEPTQTAAALEVGVTYGVELELLNETVPASDPEYRIIDEITEEAEEHLFFFTGTSVEGAGAFMTYAYADKESDYGENSVGEDLPVGIQGEVSVTAAGSGALTVTLKHMPELNGGPLKTSTATIDDGGTDLEVTFEVSAE